jgi:hypothetical protein
MRRKRRKSTVVTKHGNSFKSLECSRGCGRSVQVDVDTASVICWMCITKAVGVEERLLRGKSADIKTKSEFPRGWHLHKQYVHKDGRVFEFGIENPTLKGKLKQTEIKEKPEISKAEKRKIKWEKDERRTKRLAKKYKEKMKQLGK